MDRTVILCGLGKVGWRILDHLQAAGVPVAVIDLHASPDDPRLAGLTFIRGDCTKPELLEKAGVRTARGVIIVTSEDLVNVTTALLVRKLSAEARIVVRMFNQNLIPRLGAAVKNTVALSVSALTAPLLALTAVTGDAITAFRIEAGAQQIAEIPVDDGSDLIGSKLSAVAKKAKLLVIAHSLPGVEPTPWANIDEDTILAAGDRVVVCGAPEALAPLLAAGRAELLGGVLWAGWVRRQFRTIRRTVATVDRALLIASAVLVITLLASSAIFRFGFHKSWFDGFYHTVSVIGTGGDLPGANQPEWAKTFLSILKLAGTALVAAFTAIFTQYLIRAKLGGAFEARKIPDAGHVVVCGLGNVGFRCVEELLRLGEKVVAIDAINDNPFAATVRRMGVPVIVGNATVAAVLSQAQAGTSRAVIAATDSELANLEIALLVREMNPTLRVVVRLTDPTFATAVRDGANIKHALSVPSLAAPAFAAALFGDRVHTLVTVGTQTFAIVELTVQPTDPCLHEQTLTAAMRDYNFLPIAVTGHEPFAAQGLPKSLRLAAGNQLTVVASLPALDRLLRREPAAAEWKVIVDSYPLSAKDVLIAILRTQRGWSQEEAVAGSATPLTLAEKLTRGQAEDLTEQLEREKVTVRIEAA